MNVLRVLMLGGGIQSTTMALMAAHGQIGPMPDFALHVRMPDGAAVHDHVSWLGSGNVLPFPVVEIEGRDLLEDLRLAAAGERRISNPPFFTVHEGRDGMLRRSCTRDYKIRVARAAIRKIYEDRHGKVSPGCVENWIGISADEASRYSVSDVAYITLRYPLLERALGRPEDGLWMSIDDCILWLARHGYPVPPRSCCTICPFRSNEQWRFLRDHDADSWRQAIEIDELIRAGLPGTQADAVYLHSSRVPLAQVDLDEPDTIDLFNNECQGACGV